MPNPIEVGHFTQKDFDELGLTDSEIKQSFQPSLGAVYHVKGEEGLAKTLWIMHLYRYYIDTGYYTPYDGFGNVTIKGTKYGRGFETLKGENLRDRLWLLTHKPLRHKFVIVSEIDSEFPARDSQDKEQAEIARRMWHVQKLDNIVCYDSHVDTDDERGSTDVIFHKASHFDVYPQGVNWDTQTINFYIEDRINGGIGFWTAHDVLRTMLIYNRQELTENTIEDGGLIRPSVLKRLKQEAKKNKDLDLNNLKWERGGLDGLPSEGINEELEI